MDGYMILVNIGPFASDTNGLGGGGLLPGGSDHGCYEFGSLASGILGGDI